MRKRLAATLLLTVLLLSLGGCKLDTAALLHPDQKGKSDMVRVMIYFPDGKTLTGYVENLGMAESSKVYTGGSSVNYFYDRNGKIIGCFNYHNVLYMKILPEKENI